MDFFHTQWLTSAMALYTVAFMLRSTTMFTSLDKRFPSKRISSLVYDKVIMTSGAD
jgi:hypothetical protein